MGSQKTDPLWVIPPPVENFTPPPPPEPTALGALVEDDLARRWVRGEKGWTNLDATGAYLNWSNWDDLNDEDRSIVRVLSEGVSDV